MRRKICKNEKYNTLKAKKLTPEQTISSVQSKSSDIIPIWQKLLAKSDLKMTVEKGIFHYEIYLRAERTNRRYQITSVIKVGVSSFEYKGECYQFLLNPVDRISRCVKEPNLTIPWKRLSNCVPVLTKSELNYEEQLNKHLTRLEDYIDSVLVPEIEKEFESYLCAKPVDFA